MATRDQYLMKGTEGRPHSLECRIRIRTYTRLARVRPNPDRRGRSSARGNSPWTPPSGSIRSSSRILPVCGLLISTHGFATRSSGTQANSTWWELHRTRDRARVDAKERRSGSHPVAPLAPLASYALKHCQGDCSTGDSSSVPGRPARSSRSPHSRPSPCRSDSIKSTSDGGK